MKKLFLLMGVALIPGSAFAQDSSSPTTIETVTVTADRRAESLKDAPVAISAFTEQDLENAGVGGGDKGLTLVTPGLEFDSKAVFAEPTIRGVGSAVIAPGSDNNVGFYIDGVYQPSEAANLTEYNDIQSVEVDKGPQGTLFGRNSTGGAIRITTYDPSFDESGKANVSYGNYNAFGAALYYNMPLSDQLAFNIAGVYHRDDGYLTNVYNGQRFGGADYGGVRAKLLFQPNSHFKAILSVDFNQNDDNSTYGIKPIDNNDSEVLLGAVYPTGTYDVALNKTPQVYTQVMDSNLRMTYDLGSGTISSTTSFQNVKPQQNFDFIGGPEPLLAVKQVLGDQDMAEDLNYTSGYSGPFNWVGGIFAYHDLSEMVEVISLEANGATDLHETGNVFDTSYAAYAQGDYDITDDLRLTVGARYSMESKHAEGGVVVSPAFFLQTANTKNTWDSFTPRVALRYTINPDSDVYASYSSGFKSGAYNLVGPPPNGTPVAPEKVNAFEVGYKFADDRFTFNSSAFYYDYKDIQVAILTSTGTTFTSVLENAASARGYGADFDANYKVDDNWLLSAGLSVLDAKYEKFANDPISIPITTCGAVAPPCGNTQPPASANNTDMIQAPPLTFSFRPTYSHPLLGGNFSASGVAFYHSYFYWYPGNSEKEPAYTLVNAELSWSPSDDRYKISLWGDNLTSAKYSQWTTTSSNGTLASAVRPITYGVSVAVNF